SEGRVRGPVVTTRSRHDRAVGTWYPRAAGVAGQGVFATSLPRYGRIGTFGIQGPGLALGDVPMNADGAGHAFAPAPLYHPAASAGSAGGCAGAASVADRRAAARAVGSAAPGRGCPRARGCPPPRARSGGAGGARPRRRRREPAFPWLSTP